MSRRFDYVKYDSESTSLQETFKELFLDIEELAEQSFSKESRAKALLMTYLEIAYMWTGKAIRDQQIENDSQPDHVPERSDQ